jgi:hypothetical protein
MSRSIEIYLTKKDLNKIKKGGEVYAELPNIDITIKKEIESNSSIPL